MRRHSTVVPNRRPRLMAAVLLVGLVTTVSARASETGLSGVEGHPRGRFPLGVHAEPFGEPELDAAVRRAIDEWNAVAIPVLGAAAFAWAERPESTQVRIEIERKPGTKLMGVTYVSADAAGHIELPLRIVLWEPQARGQTSRATILFEIAAHELGHALGLAHTRDPRSLMCCVTGSIDFKDAATREAYVHARRNPDVRTAVPQLAEHYARFWR